MGRSGRGAQQSALTQQMWEWGGLNKTTAFALPDQPALRPIWRRFLAHDPDLAAAVAHLLAAASETGARVESIIRQPPHGASTRPRVIAWDPGGDPVHAMYRAGMWLAVLNGRRVAECWRDNLLVYFDLEAGIEVGPYTVEVRVSSELDKPDRVAYGQHRASVAAAAAGLVPDGAEWELTALFERMLRGLAGRDAGSDLPIALDRLVSQYAQPGEQLADPAVRMLGSLVAGERVEGYGDAVEVWRSWQQDTEDRVGAAVVVVESAALLCANPLYRASPFYRRRY